MDTQSQQQTLAKQIAVVIGGGRGIGQAITYFHDKMKRGIQ